MNKKNNRKGFTTVELVIVIAVIAILATVLIPTFSSLIGDATKAAALSDANSIVNVWLADPDNALIFTTETVLAVETEAGTFVFENNEMSKKAADATKLATLTCKNCIFLRQPVATGDNKDSNEEIKAGYVVITKCVDNVGKEEAGVQKPDGKCDTCNKPVA